MMTFQHFVLAAIRSLTVLVGVFTTSSAIEQCVYERGTDLFSIHLHNTISCCHFQADR